MSTGSNPYSSGPQVEPPVLQPGIPLPNYLVQSILVTICCCIPFGIVAIVYAAQVNGKIAMGDHAGAKASSDNAKMWCWIAFLTGLVLNIVATLVQGFVMFASLQQQNANGMGGF